MIAKQKIIENIKKGEKKKNTPDDIACELFDLIQQLIVLRKQKGLSQVELSGLVNLGKSAIGKIEKIATITIFPDGSKPNQIINNGATVIKGSICATTSNG